MKRLLSLLLALAMLLGLTACGGSSTSAVSGAAGPGAKADSAATEAKQDTPADPHRKIAPLKKAADAILVDTSELSLQESIDAVIGLMQEKLGL